MKALTIRNAWAWAIFCQTKPKNIENRSWKTDYRGTLLIHAGSQKTSLSESLAFAERIGITPCDQDLHYGCIIGSVELVYVVKNHCSLWAESAYWHWVFESPRLFEQPLYCPGQLRLWNLDICISRKVKVAKTRSLYVPGDAKGDLASSGDRGEALETPAPGTQLLLLLP